MKNPTIADVAELAGVSKSTVSAVLNNKNVVREATRRAVLSAIDELNYRPNAAARRKLGAPLGKSIGFIGKEVENPYYAEVFAGIQDVALERGYLTCMASSEGQFALEKQIVEQFTARDFEGLIVTPVLNDETDLSHIFELKRNRIPFVLLEDIRGVRAHLVDVDNTLASSEAVQYLIRQGHLHIVHFAGPHSSEHTRERAEGVRRAFSESRLVFNERTLVQAGNSLEDGYRAGLAYFRASRQERPTAVTCYNDLVALGLLKALSELGIRVPEDVSVVGFDDLHMLAFFPLALTTVRVPKYEMGRRSAELLIRQIEAKRELPVEKIALEAKLVIRNSTRALQHA